MATIDVTCADGRPLSELTKLIQQRAKWLNETAEQSCTATMLDVLVSIRALTAIAKPSKKEIQMTLTNLKPSFTGGRNNPKFCLRNGTTRYTPTNKQRIGQTSGVTKDVLKNCKVFKWIDINDREWLVVALSEKDAKDWAFNKIQKRATRFKGLARTALSILMMKSGSKTSQKMESTEAANKATQTTRVQKTGNGSTFSLSAFDLLDYAKLALKGGDGAINQALMKAANKIASVITKKCEKLLLFQPIPPPFPEVKSRK